MKLPLSWIKDFVDITLPTDDLAYRLTMAGLEVEEIHFVGLPLPDTSSGKQVTKITGFAWNPEKIVVGAIYEVMPHPNADRLVLCRLYDGQREHIVLTGASNLFPFKGKGVLDKPIKVAYAKEGAQIYDGHQPGQVLVTLKRAKIRGVESYSMACSEKELGISEDHEGIIILDEDATAGISLVEYMGDAVMDIAIMPNIARDANVLGVAREIAALTGQKLRTPKYEPSMPGPALQGRVEIEIGSPQLNPRFVLGLVENVEIRPSPYWVQRRLRLAGMRPINNIVDATNYTMLEIGQPLHAFDYDVLVRRAGGKIPLINTRPAHHGEKLRTLDDVDRAMDDFTVMVCDAGGPLSIAGIMGGAESEVSEKTRNVLLEGAAWNMINIRRTVLAQNLPSEASYRFSRGVHPAMAKRGVLRCLDWMQQWTGGQVAKGLVDHYPLPPEDVIVVVTSADVHRLLGIQLTPQEIADILGKLEFQVEINDGRVSATTPDHRLDINPGVNGVADIMEEIARIYGYDRIPETRMADALPPQRGNTDLQREERVRDLLANLGLQEVITYRLTTPDRERRLYPQSSDDTPPLVGDQGSIAGYVQLVNPIIGDRDVLRKSLLSSVLEVVERNVRLQERMAFFEIGAVFLPVAGEVLPRESRRLATVLVGARALPGWQTADSSAMDFFDLKGILVALVSELHLEVDEGNLVFEPFNHPSFHPGKCARVQLCGKVLGVMGELHPLVRQKFELPEAPLLAGEFDLEYLLSLIPQRLQAASVPVFPPVLEDLAVVIDESVPARQVESVIRQAGGETISTMRLFDVYRGDQIGSGKKSLAYSLTYQSSDRTLTDKEVSQIRKRIIQHLEQELGARLRS
jgi:phenylalanyl-tRNA synthetase beta chain